MSLERIDQLAARLTFRSDEDRRTGHDDPRGDSCLEGGPVDPLAAEAHELLMQELEREHERTGDIDAIALRYATRGTAAFGALLLNTIQEATTDQPPAPWFKGRFLGLLWKEPDAFFWTFLGHLAGADLRGADGLLLRCWWSISASLKEDRIPRIEGRAPPSILPFALASLQHREVVSTVVLTLNKLVKKGLVRAEDIRRQPGLVERLRAAITGERRDLLDWTAPTLLGG